MANFKTGDKVVWMRAVADPNKKGVRGIVTAIAESGDGLIAEFTMYEVQFPFGRAVLYGTQIEAAPRP